MKRFARDLILIALIYLAIICELASIHSPAEAVEFNPHCTLINPEFFWDLSGC